MQGDSMSKRVQSLLVFFCDREDEEVRIKALIGLGIDYIMYYTCTCTCIYVWYMYYNCQPFFI